MYAFFKIQMYKYIHNGNKRKHTKQLQQTLPRALSQNVFNAPMETLTQGIIKKYQGQ